MKVMAIASFARACVELHAQSNPLVVVAAPSAQILVFCECGAFCFSLPERFGVPSPVLFLWFPEVVGGAL